MIAQMLLQVFWKATNVGTDGLSLVQLCTLTTPRAPNTP